MILDIIFGIIIIISTIGLAYLYLKSANERDDAVEELNRVKTQSRSDYIANMTIEEFAEFVKYVNMCLRLASENKENNNHESKGTVK